MSYKIAFLFLIVPWIIMDCSVIKKDNSFLKEAAQVHNEAIALAQQLEEQLEHLTNDSTVLTDSLRVWRTDLEKWKRNLPEVSGNENHEHHEQGHHDHGKQLPELAPDQMLWVQQEMKAQLDLITSRINGEKE